MVMVAQWHFCVITCTQVPLQSVDLISTTGNVSLKSPANNTVIPPINRLLFWIAWRLLSNAYILPLCALVILSHIINWLSKYLGNVTAWKYYIIMFQNDSSGVVVWKQSMLSFRLVIMLQKRPRKLLQLQFFDSLTLASNRLDKYVLPVPPGVSRRNIHHNLKSFLQQNP